jgi:hypothetical protein
MSFLDKAPPRKNYRALGLDRNPFPTRGEVRADVYTPRPELKDLQDKLADFVYQRGKGAFYAIESNRGVGKSNFLQYIEQKLIQADEDGDIKGVAVKYVASQLVAPRHLGEAIVGALTHSRIEAWISAAPAVAPYLVGTDLGRFVAKMHKDKPKGKDLTDAVRFLMRWLSGHQTYAEERAQYDLWTREKLDPGAAFPYLRGVVDGMVQTKGLSGIVLLIDEAEDLLSGSDAYAQALKALVNSFNFDNLFIIMAGQEGAISRVGTQLTSLASRWKVVKLLPLKSSKAAIALAHSYLGPAAESAKRQPNDVEVEAAFGRLAPAHPGGVPQRELLGDLHDLVEKRASGRG